MSDVSELKRSPRIRLNVDERRKQILRASRRLFNTKPYSEITTDDLADAAGIKRQNLLYHFGSKRALYLEVVKDYFRFPAWRYPTIPPAMPLKEAVAQMVTYWLDSGERTSGLYVWSFRSGSGGADKELDEVVSQGREKWALEFAKLLPVENATSVKTLALFRIFQATAFEALEEWLGRGNLSREDVHVLLCDILENILAREFGSELSR